MQITRLLLLVFVWLGSGLFVDYWSFDTDSGSKYCNDWATSRYNEIQL